MSSSNASSFTSSTSSSSQQPPLTDLSPNTTSPPKPTDTTDPFKPANKDEMPTTSREQAATYISPSDAMLSPTTKKLSEIKGRRFASAKTSQMGSRALFQKAVMGVKENTTKPSGESQ